MHPTNFCSLSYRLVVPYRQHCSRCRLRSTPTRSAHCATKDAPMRAITFAEVSMRVVRDSAVATLVAHWSMITNRLALSRGASSLALWHRTRVSTARWPTILTGSKRSKSYWLRSRRVWTKYNKCLILIYDYTLNGIATSLELSRYQHYICHWHSTLDRYRNRNRVICYRGGNKSRCSDVNGRDPLRNHNTIFV